MSMVEDKGGLTEERAKHISHTLDNYFWTRKEVEKRIRHVYIDGYKMLSSKWISFLHRQFVRSKHQLEVRRRKPVRSRPTVEADPLQLQTVNCDPSNGTYADRAAVYRITIEKHTRC